MSKNKQPLASGAVPPHYREALYWRITQSSWRMTMVNLLSLPLAIVFGVAFFGWAALWRRLSDPFRVEWSALLVVLGAAGLTLIVHELGHGGMMRHYGARPKYGVLWQGLMLYATAPGFAFRRSDYLAVILAPLVSLSLLALMALMVLPTMPAVMVALCATINAAGAGGDLWIAQTVLRFPKQAYCVDERDGVRIFMPG